MVEKKKKVIDEEFEEIEKSLKIYSDKMDEELKKIMEEDIEDFIF
ncbi:MAG: hypothetical protein ACRC0V_09035 [Fusobacteriaceae bacterium]